jgi:hypothetical protein
MTDPTRLLIEQFPECAVTIRQMIERGANFNALCHAFSKLSGEPARLAGSPEAESHTEEFRKRSASVADELLVMIQ